jgi:hypothetical protein
VASDGGKRGMTLRITLPASASASVDRLEQTLSAFLFETQVEVAGAGALKRP